METTFDITQKTIKNYVGIVQIKIDDKLYHVYTMNGSKVWLACAFAYSSPQGLKDPSLYNLFFIRKDVFANKFSLRKIFSNIKHCYREYENFKDICEKNNVEYMDATSMLSEIAHWHKYLDFYLIKYGNNRYQKILEPEFDEAIRNLHRLQRYNIEVVHITDTEQKIMFAAIDAKIHKSYLLYCVDESVLNMKRYVHVNRVSDNDNHTPKDGYLIFLKQGSVERFMLVYFTVGSLAFSEKTVISINSTYNSFISKIVKKRGLDIIKIVEFTNYKGSIYDIEYQKAVKKKSINASYITDYECTDILTKAEEKNTVQVIDVMNLVMKYQKEHV